MSNVFTICENCKTQYPHQLLTRCEKCGSESVYQDKEVERESKEDNYDNEEKRTVKDFMQNMFL